MKYNKANRILIADYVIACGDVGCSLKDLSEEFNVTTNAISVHVKGLILENFYNFKFHKRATNTNNAGPGPRFKIYGEIK